MSDDAEQTPKAPDPAPAVPSPQMFARPAPPVSERHPIEPDGTEQDGTEQDTAGADAPAGGGTSRFASTGDPRVDRALAQLPDPDEHRRGAGDGSESTESSESRDAATGIDLPDPGLLDAHLADVTSVHRQLQQRLSDLSG